MDYSLLLSVVSSDTQIFPSTPHALICYIHCLYIYMYIYIDYSLLLSVVFSYTRIFPSTPHMHSFAIYIVSMYVCKYI